MQATFVGPTPLYCGIELIEILPRLERTFTSWRGEGEVQDNDAGLVVLNPMVPDMRIWFMISFGPTGAGFLENAIRKLYATYRTERDTLVIAEECRYLFRPGEFQYGGAVRRHGMYAGVSGWTARQDHMAAAEALEVLNGELGPLFDVFQAKDGGKYVAHFDHSKSGIPLPPRAIDYVHGDVLELFTPYRPGAGMNSRQGPSFRL